MAKMTKAQAKRMVRDIESKAKKLFVNERTKGMSGNMAGVVSVQDMAAIEKLCSKWMKRIG
tara:strand:- start:3660 stop:3842 length:183 start_codon:yes stop_codon:yes gene_type:complete